MDKLFRLAGINCAPTSPAHLYIYSKTQNVVHKHQFYPVFSDETPTALSTAENRQFHLLISDLYTQSTGPITTTTISINLI